MSGVFIKRSIIELQQNFTLSQQARRTHLKTHDFGVLTKGVSISFIMMWMFALLDTIEFMGVSFSLHMLLLTYGISIAVLCCSKGGRFSTPFSAFFLRN